MENGTAVHYVAVDIPRTENPSSMSHSTPPTLPPLIKIDQTIPVGYSTALFETTNGEDRINTSEEQSKISRTSEARLSQYRPTIINLMAPPSLPTSLHLAAHPYSTTPLDPSPLMPRPLVEPVDSDRPERMRDWLVRMIESGRFPGLKWLNQDQMIFRVPWIHAKKRDYNQERDAALFREWAIHSGKYGDGSDVTTWKINFRCALNGLKDIIERRELEEPDCRVYQMLPTTSSARRRKRRRPGGLYSSEVSADFHSPTLERDVRPRLELGGPPGSRGTPYSTATLITSTSGGAPPIQVVPLLPTGTPITPLATPIGTPIGTPIRILSSPTTPQNSQIGFIQKLKTIIPATNISPVVTKHFDLSSVNHLEIGCLNNHNEGGSQPPTPHTPISPLPVAQFSPKVISPPPLPTTNTMHPPPPSSHHHHSSVPGHALSSMTMHPSLRTGPVYCPPTEFYTNPNAIIVRILYGSITVHLETLDCSQGTRIYYGPLHCRDILDPQLEEVLFGPLDAQQIPLSPRHPAVLAKEIFANFKRGLILEAKDGCVYATALCRTVVYYGSSPVKHSNTLQKEETTKVFNYPHRFTPSLKYTVEGRNQPPKPYVVFSLGQPWSCDRPLSKNLVTVVVTYCKALHDLQTRNIPIYDELLFEAQEARDIRIIAPPTQEDIEADEFLNPKCRTL